MKAMYFLLIVFLVSCNETSSSKNNLENSVTYQGTLKSELIGNWGGLGEDSPVFDIRQDSIYYYNRSTAFPYEIINHDLIIHFPQSRGILRDIKIIKDTVFWLDDQGIITKGYRFKATESK